MPEDTAGVNIFSNMSDLEKKILTVLSVFESGRKLKDPDEYVLSEGKCDISI